MGNASIFADLSHRTCVVTGGSSGIGKAVGEELARAGAQVIFHYAHAKTATQQIVESIREQGGTAWAVGADFHDPDNFPTFLEDTWAISGSVDAWIHCAGVDLLTGPAAKLSYSSKLEELLQVDVRATMLLCREAGARMRTAGRGSIVTIGWDQSDRGMEGDSGELFAAAKNAIMGFTRSLALSLAPHVRVNCIAPGWIKTAWGETASEVWQERVLRETPLKRWGLPSDIANVVRFLVSEEASFVTGQVVNVNGGSVR